jgi:hypothetical protein
LILSNTTSGTTALANLSGTLLLVLPLVVLVPQPAAGQAEPTAIVAGGLLTRSCSTRTSAGVAAAVTPGHSIARLGTTSEWLSAISSNAVLLSFIDTSEQSTGGPDNPDMSRRLLVFIRSIRTQYSSDAVAVVLVDGSDSSKSDDGERLVNFRYDNELIDTPMLVGTAGMRAMRELGVRCLPTTFLIDRDAQVTVRWEGLVLPSTIAQAIAAQGNSREVVD